MTQTSQQDAAPCLSCPKLCTAYCPAHEASAREAYSPWAKISLMTLATSLGAKPGASEAQSFAACTGCLRCLHHCPHGFDVPKALESARGAAARAGTAPAALGPLPLRFAQAGHGEERDLRAVHQSLVPQVAAAQARGEARRAEEQGAAVPSITPRLTSSRAAQALGPPLLLAGCDALAQGGGLALQALAVAAALGEPLALGPEGALCCGEKLAQAGHHELLAAHAARTRSALFEEKRPRPLHLVLLAPGCTLALQERWPSVKAGLPEGSVVEHLTTFLSRALARAGGSSRPRLPGAVTWHDPCQLARGLREVTAPRALLAAAVEELREPVRCAEETSCCGFGGLVSRALPDLSREMARQRSSELRDCGAPAVTSSPGCSRQLGAEELVSLLARWLGVD